MSITNVSIRAKAKGSGTGSASSTIVNVQTVAKASTADYAEEAGHAEEADKAAYADKAGHATKADYATTAGTALSISDDSELWDKFLRKDTDDTASGVITFLKGILFGENGLFSIDENGNAVLNDAVLSGSLTTGGDATVGGDVTVTGDVKSSNFSEAEQSGFGIVKSSSGKWNAFFTNLTIWGKAIFNELEIRKLSAVGGSIVLSAASSKILLVEDYYVNDEMVGWKCWYLADDGTTATQNGWQVGDQARCQSFNIEEGTYENVGNKDYWRCVIAVSSENEKIYDDDGNELYDGQEFGWIVLSLTNAQASDYGSTYSGASWDEEYAYNSTPAADDAIVLYGHQPQDDDNSDELNRMNLIILTAAEDDPQILMYQGIYTFSLEGRLVAKMAPSGWEILSSSFTWNTGSVTIPNYVNMNTEWTDGCTADQYTIWYYNGETWRFDGYTDEDGNVVTSTTETPATGASGWVQLTYNSAVTSVVTYYCKSETLEQPDDSEFVYTSIADTGLDFGEYLWWRIDTTYGSGSTSSTYGVSRLGEDGATGATGATGTDGVTHYYHFAYSTSSDGSENFSTTTFDGATYWGVYTDENEADSEDYADYAWTKIKGDKGDTGEAGADGADGADGEDSLTLTASPSSVGVNNAETETVTVNIDFYDGKTLLQIGDTEATYVYDDGESEIGYDDGSSVSETSSSFDFGVYNAVGTLCSVGDTLTTGLIYKSIGTSSTHTAVLTFQVAAGTTLNGYVGYVKATYDGETRYSYIMFTTSENGADGADGSSALRIDLSNEVEPVLSDSNGTVLESTIAGTTAALYYGATDVTSLATWTCTGDGITASITSAGVVSVSSMTAEKASVVITAEYNGFTATATYSLYKTATAKYSLQLSTNAVSVASDGTVSASSVTATILMTTGDGTTSITSGAYSSYGVSLLYALDGATTSTGYSTSGTLTVTPSSSNSSIEFYLVQGQGKSSATISGYTILDQETVPIVKDGYALTASSSNNAVNVDDGSETVEYVVDFTIGGTIQKIGDEEATYLYDDSSEIGYDDGSSVSTTGTSYTFAVYNASGTKCVVGDSLTDGLIYKSCESSSTHTAVLTFTLAKGIVLNGYKAYVKIVYGDYTGYVYLPFTTVTDGVDGADGADGADGTSPCQIILTNEAEVVACDGLGNVSDASSIEGTSWVFYEGLTAVAIADYDYTVTASGCTVSTSVSAATGTITVTAMSSDMATVTVAVTYEGNTYSRIYTLTKNYSGLSYAIVVSPAVISVDADGALNTSTLTYGVRVYDNGTVTTYTDLSTSGDAYTKYGLYLYWMYKDGTSYTRLTSTSGSMALSDYSANIISYGGLTLLLYQGGTYSTGTLVDKEGIELVTDGEDGNPYSFTPSSIAVAIEDSLVYASYLSCTLACYDTDGNSVTISDVSLSSKSSTTSSCSISGTKVMIYAGTQTVTYTDQTTSSTTSATASYTSGYVILKVLVNGQYYYHTVTWTIDSSNYLISTVKYDNTGISLLVTTVEDIENGLDATGINITNHTVTITGSSFFILNNSGEQRMYVNEDGQFVFTSVDASGYTVTTTLDGTGITTMHQNGAYFGMLFSGGYPYCYGFDEDGTAVWSLMSISGSDSTSASLSLSSATVSCSYSGSTTTCTVTAVVANNGSSTVTLSAATGFFLMAVVQFSGGAYGFKCEPDISVSYSVAASGTVEVTLTGTTTSYQLSSSDLTSARVTLMYNNLGTDTTTAVITS